MKTSIIYIAFDKIRQKISYLLIIYGATAQQHIIKMDDRCDLHHRKFAERVVNTVMDEYNKELKKIKLFVLTGKKRKIE